MPIAPPTAADLAKFLTIDPSYEPGFWVVFELTAETAHHHLWDAIHTQRWPPRLFDDIADALVEKVVGWKRGEATHIWAQSRGAWQMIEGDHLGRGVDVLALDPAQATNVCFVWWQQRFRHDSDGWKKWVRDMETPLRRYTAATVESAVMTVEQIAALSQAGKAPSPR